MCVEFIAASLKMPRGSLKVGEINLSKDKIKVRNMNPLERFRKNYNPTIVLHLDLRESEGIVCHRTTTIAYSASALKF